MVAVPDCTGYSPGAGGVQMSALEGFLTVHANGCDFYENNQECSCGRDAARKELSDLRTALEEARSEASLWKAASTIFESGHGEACKKLLELNTALWEAEDIIGTINGSDDTSDPLRKKSCIWLEKWSDK